MKKLLVLLLISVAFVSCDTNTPKATAEKFTESMAKGDMEEAKKYMTAGTASLLDMAMKMSSDSIPKYQDFKFKMIKDSIVGDTIAWVTYTSPLGSQEELNLVKQDGQWKVTMGK